MGTVVEIRGKTEQRVIAVISALKGAQKPLSYDDLRDLTSAHYDTLLYILTTLIELGHVEKHEVREGPGRPRILFSWKASSRRAQALGAR